MFSNHRVVKTVKIGATVAAFLFFAKVDAKTEKFLFIGVPRR